MLPLTILLQIFLPGTQPGDIVHWPLQINLNCRECHGRYSPDHFEPWDTWTGSMMANSARDPLFWAAVDIANQDSPGVGEWCIRCHSPKAWLEGRSSAPDGSAFQGSMSVPGGDFEGVDCQFCHRMYEGPTGTPFTQNAQFWVHDPSGALPPPHRGPYDESKAPHPWLYSPYHLSSTLCAVCHNVKNPLVNLLDENGADTGLLFPEQSTFDEWSQSDYAENGVQCQSCHMPRAQGYACTDFFPTRDVGTHAFAGANAWMTSVLGELYGSALDREEGYQQSLNLALDMLQNQSASLVLSTPSRIESGTDVTIGVRVVNLTGHKLPTGYPEGRRMWIHLSVSDGYRQTIFESGRYDFGTADLIQDSNLRVYETQHGIHGVGNGFHLALSNRIFKDTRIPPAGFFPNIETQPVGITFATQPDGSLANWDDAEYVVTIPEGTPSPLTVHASLYYQTGSKEYFEFLRDENVSGPDPHDPDPDAPNRGEKMYTLWSDHEKCPPILMKGATRRITVDGPPLVNAPSPVDEGALLGSPVITASGPNPFRDATWIEFAVPRQVSSAAVQVFDIAGRNVQTLRARAAGAKMRAEWNGRDAEGREVSTGAYFFRLEVPGFAPQIRRLILMR
jgi:hypothetical protein